MTNPPEILPPRAGPETPPALPALVADRTLPASGNPAATYLASLAEGAGRISMRSTLAQIASELGFRIEDCPWHELRHAHVMALRSRWQAEFAPATANKRLSAVRGVLRQAWMLNLIDSEDYQRALAVRNVKGSRLPAGRALDGGELQALFKACADGSSAGARDAAAFALMFGCGLRRSEAAEAQMDDYDAATGALRIIGKGNKERTVYATGNTLAALEAWLAIRGRGRGSILLGISKGGGTMYAGMSAQAIMYRLKLRARQASIGECSPHDLRRSFVSAALEGGADLAMVQALAGHANPATTARYDRRPEAAKRQAAQIVRVPFAPSRATS